MVISSNYLVGGIFVRFMSWLSGGKLDFHSQAVSEEEFEAFIDMSHAGGAVEEDEKRQIKTCLVLPI